MSSVGDGGGTSPAPTIPVPTVGRVVPSAGVGSVDGLVLHGRVSFKTEEKTLTENSATPQYVLKGTATLRGY